MRSLICCLAAVMLLGVFGCSSKNPEPVSRPVSTQETAKKIQDPAELRRYAYTLVKDVVSSIPKSERGGRVAIATPVDVASLEHTDWLGRELAEYFVSAMHENGFQVLEYKLTGWLEITANGDYIYSRNWQKLAGKASVSKVLSGTMSRNDNGVMVYARLVNLKTSMVEGTSEIFIPYENLPSCYRLYPKTCGDHPVYDSQIKDPSTGGVVNGKASSTTRTSTANRNTQRAQNRSTTNNARNSNARRNTSGATRSSQRSNNSSTSRRTQYSSRTTTRTSTTTTSAGSPTVLNNSRGSNSYSTSDNSASYRVDGSQATSNGNMSIPCESCAQSDAHCHAECSDPDIYPASSGLYGGSIVRDVRNQSQYDRR